MKPIIHLIFDWVMGNKNYKAQIYQNAPSKKVALTYLNNQHCPAFCKFAPH